MLFKITIVYLIAVTAGYYIHRQSIKNAIETAKAESEAQSKANAIAGGRMTSEDDIIFIIADLMNDEGFVYGNRKTKYNNWKSFYETTKEFDWETFANILYRAYRLKFYQQIDKIVADSGNSSGINQSSFNKQKTGIPTDPSQAELYRYGTLKNKIMTFRDIDYKYWNNEN